MVKKLKVVLPSRLCLFKVSLRQAQGTPSTGSGNACRQAQGKQLNERYWPSESLLFKPSFIIAKPTFTELVEVVKKLKVVLPSRLCCFNVSLRQAQGKSTGSGQVDRLRASRQAQGKSAGSDHLYQHIEGRLWNILLVLFWAR